MLITVFPQAHLFLLMGGRRVVSVAMLSVGERSRGEPGVLKMQIGEKKHSKRVRGKQDVYTTLGDETASEGRTDSGSSHKKLAISSTDQPSLQPRIVNQMKSCSHNMGSAEEERYKSNEEDSEMLQADQDASKDLDWEIDCELELQESALEAQFQKEVRGLTGEGQASMLKKANQQKEMESEPPLPMETSLATSITRLLSYSSDIEAQITRQHQLSRERIDAHYTRRRAAHHAQLRALVTALERQLEFPNALK